MQQKIKLKGRLRVYLSWPLLLTIVLVVLNVPLYFVDPGLGGLFSGFVVLYFVVVLLVYKSSKPALLSELVNFATQYGTVQRRLLEEFEVSCALLDCTGKILWVNKQFTALTGKSKDYHKSITSIFPSMTREVLERGEGTIPIELPDQKKYFRASMDRLAFDDIADHNNVISVEKNTQFLTILYLFDETRLHRYIQENKDQKLVCGLVYIDNYEEALASIEEVKRSLLVALVDRKVNKYFAERDSLVKKLEKDKYFVVFRQKFLKDLIEDRFSVMEDVKTIRVGNEMAVTLSIGIGIGGVNYNQNYEFSRMAMDLALGRGGDQTVIKDGEKTTYYGGKTRQVEKMTRVKARVKAHALREILESRERVVIMGHAISDVDSFGAAIGIYCAARVLGKKAYIVLNEVSASLRPFKEQFTEERGYPHDMFVKNETAKELVDANTLVMVVDTNRPNYTECPELLSKAKTIVVFDHHRQCSDGIANAVLSYVESYASSTCEMVAEVLQYFTENIHLKPQEADCIYAGILIDTDNFNTKTGVRTFEAAAYLRRCGAEMTRVRKLMRDDMKAHKAKAEAIRQADVYRDMFAIAVCPGTGLESPTIVGAQAANELLNINGIKASFVLTEYNGKIYVSSRSIDEINVQLIMERIGGGGHMNMAGAQIADCSVNEAMIILENTLDQMIEEGEINI